MPAKANNTSVPRSTFQTVGLTLAGVFYLVSIIMVIYNHSKNQGLGFDGETITFAHWNLEDGFREGFDEAIRLFKEMKAEQGENVNVVQTTVPVRGYKQWFLTQLIGGSPADVMKYMGSSNILNQYFIPLTEYIGKPNPYNQGTIMQGVPWKNTYVDDMANSMDPVYSEYFGVGTYFHTSRIFVNMELLENATGSRKLPETFSEWMEDCRRIREYGDEHGIPTIPIGVRGFDKSTLVKIFSFYLAQTNGDLNDEFSEFCSPMASRADILKALNDDSKVREKLLAAADIATEAGRYFCEGFSATDLEQTKFLFFSGNVGFFPEGTWNGYSMVNNSPFEVEVFPMPPIGENHKYSKYFTGRVSEQGVRVGGAFGIPKATKHFKLALEFLQFITSYDVNQLVMNYCKWPPAVRKAKYDGLMKKFKPNLEGDHLAVTIPFYCSTKTQNKMMEILEAIIAENKQNVIEDFWSGFLDNKKVIEEELEEALIMDQRNYLNLESRRTTLAAKALRGDLSKKQRERVECKQKLALENYAGGMVSKYQNRRYLEELRKTK